MQPLLLGLSLIDLAVVAGVALVLPVSLGGARWWRATAVAVAASCLLTTGSVAAVALALIWPALGTAAALRSLRRAGPPQTWTLATAVQLLAYGYALVAACWFALSRVGVTPLGIGEPIVELTAVHFTYAGVGALILALVATRAARSPAGRRLGTCGLALTAGAPPVVAAGFVTEVAVAQVGGAVLMSLGVFATAALHLAAARREHSTATRLLLAASGLAVWAPMALAVAWSAAQHTDLAALSIPDMVRTHGSLNAVGFIGCGLLARHRQGRLTHRADGGDTLAGSRRSGSPAAPDSLLVAPGDGSVSLGHQDREDLGPAPSAWPRATGVPPSTSGTVDTRARR